MQLYEDERYSNQVIEPLLPIEIEQPVIPTTGQTQIDQVTVPQVTANQDNYPVPPGGVIEFSTDAARNFTGFSGARPGLVVFSNVGSFDGVLVNNSASSTTENRVLCHTGANITLNPGESALMYYSFSLSRWKTIGFV